MQDLDKKNKTERGKKKRDVIITGKIALEGGELIRLKNIHRARIIENIRKGEIEIHIWTLDNWEKHYNLSEKKHRKGLHVRFENQVDPDVKIFCKKFCKWLRKNYFFPQKVTIYFKAATFVKAGDGDHVSAIFSEPRNRYGEPHIRIATGDYKKNLIKCGDINAIGGILGSIAHELTHYFQWINDIQLTEIGYERQATTYSRYIVYEYFEDMNYEIEKIKNDGV